MIALISPLQLDVKPEVTHLVLWCCPPWDERYSFRSTLESIRKILSAQGSTKFDLPEEAPDEDFVTGSMSWKGLRFDIYFEYVLGYLQFSSTIYSQIETLRAVLITHVQLAEDS